MLNKKLFVGNFARLGRNGLKLRVKGITYCILLQRCLLVGIVGFFVEQVVHNGEVAVDFALKEIAVVVIE